MADTPKVKFLQDFETNPDGSKRSKAETIKAKSDFIKSEGFAAFEQIVRNGKK